MAIGFPPRFSTHYKLHGMSPQHFLVLAVEAAGHLGWPLRHLSASGIVTWSPDGAQQLTVRLRKNAARIECISRTGMVSDKGKSKSTSQQFTALLGELRAAISTEELEAAHERLQVYMPPDGNDFLKEKKGARFSDVLHLFRPAEGYFVTPILVNLNVLVFLAMLVSGVSVSSPDSASLLRWGANLGTLTLAGQWWRLLSSTFIHIGLTHLAMNMVALMLIGAQLEPRIGRLRFMSAYLLSGVIASLCSVLWHGSTISAGASGAIFGMYGVFLALVVAGLVRGSNKRQLVAIVLFFVVYNLLNGLQPGIDNAAHAGGLVSGFLVGYAFVPGLKRQYPHAPQAPEPTESNAFGSTEEYY